MSGGSLNYLCYAKTSSLFDRINDMEYVEKTLLEHGYKDIAADVRRLIEYCISAENRITVLFDNLNDVFHAVEWYRSADYGEDCLIEHLEAYRTGGEK